MKRKENLWQKAAYSEKLADAFILVMTVIAFLGYAMICVAMESLVCWNACY